MEEIWRKIKGFEDYGVSNYGRIHSIKSNIIMNTPLSAGYPAGAFRKNGKTYHFRVHRLVALMFIDNPNNYKLVNHKDHNRTNNYFENLEWCDQKHNMLECAKIGKGNTSFNIDTLRIIKTRLFNGERGCDLATEYNTTRATITDIKNDKIKVAKSLGIETKSIIPIPISKFTIVQILEVKRLLNEGLSLCKIENITNIKSGTVFKIKKGLYDHRL